MTPEGSPHSENRDFSHLPARYDQENDSATWYPRISYPPRFYTKDYKVAVKDLNKFLRKGYWGFAVSINRPKKAKVTKDNPFPDYVKVTLRCGCGRKYERKSREKEAGGRDSSSRMKGCIWKGVLRYTRNLEGDWGWDLEVSDPSHNH